MHLNIKPTDHVAVLASINPSSQAAGTATSGWVSLADFRRALCEIDVGAFGASATVDAKVQQATDTSGTSAKDVSNKAITQLLAAGGNNRQALINIAVDELDLANGFSCIQLSITVGTAATLTAGRILGFTPRFAPPVDSGANPAINLGASTVAQIVP